MLTAGESRFVWTRIMAIQMPALDIHVRRRGPRTVLHSPPGLPPAPLLATFLSFVLFLFRRKRCRRFFRFSLLAEAQSFRRGPGRTCLILIQPFGRRRAGRLPGWSCLRRRPRRQSGVWRLWGIIVIRIMVLIMGCIMRRIRPLAAAAGSIMAPMTPTVMGNWVMAGPQPEVMDRIAFTFSGWIGASIALTIVSAGSGS